MQRVFISGVGLVCPLGNDRKTVWRQLLAGQSGVAQLTQIDVSDLEVKIGGEVRNFDPKIVEVNERTAARKMDRASLFAVAAALQALDDAGLAEHSLGRNGAVVLGAGLSGLLTLQEQTENLLRGGPRKVSPMTIPLLMPNAAAANICIATGFKGPAYTVSSACASSGHAMIDAARLIACGEAVVPRVSMPLLTNDSKLSPHVVSSDPLPDHACLRQHLDAIDPRLSKAVRFARGIHHFMRFDTVPAIILKGDATICIRRVWELGNMLHRDHEVLASAAPNRPPVSRIQLAHDL